MRDEVKAANPGIKFGEVGKVLGERWKAASADDKARFEVMAKEVRCVLCAVCAGLPFYTFVCT